MCPGSRYPAIFPDAGIDSDSLYDSSDTTIEDSVLASTELDKGEINGQLASLSRDDNGRVDNNGDTNYIKGSTGFPSTEFERGGKNEIGTFHRSYRVYSLTWEDANGQKQQICPQNEVMLQIYMGHLG